MSLAHVQTRYFQHNEAADAARRLLSAFHGLIFRDVPDTLNPEEPQDLMVDLRPSLPRRRAKLFLGSLEDVAQSLKLEMASRKYRVSFTKNYRSLMPADRRAYRIDVLEAAQDGHSALWVNGKKYLLGQEVLQDKEKLRASWFSLLNGLRNLQVELDSSANQRTECIRCTSLQLLENPSCGADKVFQEFQSLCQFCITNWYEKLGLLLVKFDLIWCGFERNYINELIDIERQSKKVIMDCVYLDEELRHYEKLFTRVIASNHTCSLDPELSLTSTPPPASSLQQQRQRTTTSLNDSLINSVVVANSNFSLASTENDTTLTNEAQKNKIEQKSTTHCHITDACCSYNFCVEQSNIITPENLDFIMPFGTITTLFPLYTQIRQGYIDLISAIATLNVAANARRKGRGDYSLNLFETAACIMHRLTSTNSLFSCNLLFPYVSHQEFCIQYLSNSSWIQSLQYEQVRGLEIIALPLLENLKSIRNYFSHIGELPERIDPHLCQNSDLVTNLARLELSWDTAATHLITSESILRLTNFLKFVLEIMDQDSNMIVDDHDLFSCFSRAELSSTMENSENLGCYEIKNDKSNNTFDPEKTPPPSSYIKDLTNNKKKNVRQKRESLEEMIATCDVAALLAIPKLAILYYLLNPSMNSINTKLITFLLPSIYEDFQLKQKQKLTSPLNVCESKHFTVPNKTNVASTKQTRLQSTSTLRSSHDSKTNSLEDGRSSKIQKTTTGQKTPSTLRSFPLMQSKTVSEVSTVSPEKCQPPTEANDTKDPSLTPTPKNEIPSIVSTTKNEFFKAIRQFKSSNSVYVVPECFSRIMKEAINVIDAMEKPLQKVNGIICLSSELEELVWRCLVDRCISNIEYEAPNFPTFLERSIDSFCLALEEASMLLQRTNPVEWNAFLQITMKCIDYIRRKNACILTPTSSCQITNVNNPETALCTNNDFSPSPQSARLFQSSPVTTRSFSL